MQLNPREQFAVVRQLEDPYDAGTYYVRAVVRNAYTDAIIATLDLVLKDNQRYAYPWLVPADVSGQGFWISVVSSVYTDSGHTTKSQNYGDRLDTYLVQERVNPLLNQAGGAGGPDIDYKKIAKIVDASVARQVKAIKIPKMPEIPEFPEPLKTDVIGPVRASEKAIIGAIGAIKIPPQAPFTPILTAVRMLRTDLAKHFSDLNKAISEQIATATTKIEAIKLPEDLEASVEKGVSKSLEGARIEMPAMAVALKEPVEPKPEPKVEPKPEAIVSPYKQDRVKRILA